MTRSVDALTVAVAAQSPSVTTPDQAASLVRLWSAAIRAAWPWQPQPALFPGLAG